MSSSPTDAGAQTLVDLTMPQMGVSVVEGTVADDARQDDYERLVRIAGVFVQLEQFRAGGPIACLIAGGQLQ